MNPRLAGGGTVLLQSGTFLTGSIVLKSNVTLWIDTTATLLGSQNDTDYPVYTPPSSNTNLLGNAKALIYAEGAVNIGINGGGTLDANGDKSAWLINGSENTRP